MTMVDVKQPVENPALVTAIEALRQHPSAETESGFFAQLRQAHFLLVLQDKLIHDAPDEDGNVVLTQGSTISIPMLSDKDGRPLHFGFTDWPSLSQWREQSAQQTLIVPFEQLSDLVLKEGTDCAGFLVNPSTHNFLIPRCIIAHISGKADSYTVQKETKVMLGEPKEYPHDLVNAVKQRLKSIKEVKRAWLMLMVKDNEHSHLIVLEHTGDRAMVSQAVGTAASPHLKNGMFVDIVTTEQEFGKNAAEGKKPFYKRGLFG